VHDDGARRESWLVILSVPEGGDVADYSRIWAGCGEHLPTAWSASVEQTDAVDPRWNDREHLIRLK
jgi:hypothetical protein